MGTDRLVGRTIAGRYHVEEMLGEGGMAVVYRATDSRLEREVALKVIRIDLYGPALLEPLMKRFEREARAMARMEHPNIVKIYDYGEFEGAPYLVMQYLQGGSLVQKAGSPIPYKEAAGLLLSVARAIEYAHKREIIHRDVKPANILFTSEGTPMLCDFGIAKIVDVEETLPLTKTGMGIGTPEYMAPEQWRGKVVPQTDIYALCVVFYELVTGVRPYTADTPGSVFEKIISEPLPSPRELVPDLPVEVEQVMSKAMAKDVGERYRSMSEFASALERLALAEEEKTLVVQGRERSVTTPATKPGGVDKKEKLGEGRSEQNKNQKLIWGCGIAALLLALVGILAGAGFLASQGESLLALLGGGKMTPTVAATREVQSPIQPTEYKPIATQAKIEQTIKIGVLAPLSGPAPTFGVSTRDGILLAMEEWNGRGGVLGKQIEAIIEDSQCTADPAVIAASKLIDQDKVHYLIGEVCSPASIPVSEVANERGVLQISPASTNPMVTVAGDGTTRPYTFRACFIDPFQGLVMAKFATGKGYRTAFILFDPGNDYVRGLAEAFEEAFVVMGGTIVGKESYIADDTDFSAILSKVAESKAEILWIPDYYNIVNLVGAQAKAKGISAVLMGGDGWDSPDLDLMAADGGFFSNHYSPEDTRPIVQEWVSKYTAVFGIQPDAIATLSYDAANILFASIENAGVDDASRVKDAMAAIRYEAVSGMITFDQYNNPIKGAVVNAVKDGRVTFVEAVVP